MAFMIMDDYTGNLIDKWDIGTDDDVAELFSTFRVSTEMHIKNNDYLTLTGAIRIIKDFRDYINPHNDKNLFYFTDVVCDNILSHFIDLEEKNLIHFVRYIDRCVERVYLRI